MATLQTGLFGGLMNKMKGFADDAKRAKYREQVKRDIVMYKSQMPLEMEDVVYRLFIDALTMFSDDNDQLAKLVQAGINDVYYKFAPWNVVIGPGFGASITYQLDTCIFFKLIDQKVLIWR